MSAIDEILPLAITREGNINLPSLVLLHGFLGSKSDWHLVVSKLKQQFHCICIDLPGHGNSAEFPLPTPGFDACAKLILHTLTQYGIKQFHLLGYSLGGRIALHIAKLAPEKLLSLQLESCHPGLLTQELKLARQQNDHIWTQRLMDLSIKDFLTLWYQQAVFKNMTCEQREHVIELRCNNNSLALVNCYQATSLALQQNLWHIPDLLTKKYNIQCRFYVGDKDLKFSSLAQKWQQQSSLEVIKIEKAGHNVHLENPQMLAQYLISSL